MYEFHDLKYLLKNSAYKECRGRMKYVFPHESQKAKVCHNGKNDRPKVFDMR